jgi:hypothetical protein
MNISELQKRVHATAVDRGWHESDELDANSHPTARQKLAWLALVTDELDEADAEEDALYYGPEGKPEGKLIEIVDAMIRLLDMAGACGWRIAIDGLDDPNDYDIAPTRSGLVGAIRTGASNQESHAAALFLALIAELERERREDTDHEMGHVSPSMEELFAIKDAYNRTRPHRHGGKLA